MPIIFPTKYGHSKKILFFLNILILYKKTSTIAEKYVLHREDLCSVTFKYRLADQSANFSN